MLSRNGQSQKREVANSQLQWVSFGKAAVSTFLIKNIEKLSLSHTKLKFANFINKSTIINLQNIFFGLNFLSDTWWILYKPSSNSIFNHVFQYIVLVSCTIYMLHSLLCLNLIVSLSFGFWLPLYWCDYFFYRSWKRERIETSSCHKR